MIMMMMHSRASRQLAGGIHRAGSRGRRGTLCQPCPRSLGTAVQQWHQTVKKGLIGNIRLQSFLLLWEPNISISWILWRIINSWSLVITMIKIYSHITTIKVYSNITTIKVYSNITKHLIFARPNPVETGHGHGEGGDLVQVQVQGQVGGQILSEIEVRCKRLYYNL